MRVIFNKVQLGQFHGIPAYVRLLGYHDNEPVIEQMLRSEPRTLEDAFYESSGE